MGKRDDPYTFLSKIRQPKRKAFLRAICETYVIGRAADAVGINRSSHYAWMHDPEYKAAFESAREVGADTFEDALVDRAMIGLERRKFHHGMQIMIPCEASDPNAVALADDSGYLKPYVEREYSDTLGIFLMKGIKPEKYRDRIEHATDPDFPVADRISACREAIDRELQRRRIGLPTPDTGNGDGGSGGSGGPPPEAG